MLLKSSKHTEASKLLRIQRAGNIVARGESESPKCSGMVSTLITKTTIVTVHVLYGEPGVCVGRIARTFDMRVPAAHVYEPG